MEFNKTDKVQDSAKVMIGDEHYFVHVFKKTEKIVCAVFYVLKDIKDISGRHEQTIREIEHAAHQTLSFAANTLSEREYTASDSLVSLLSQLTVLRSHIEIGRAVGFIRPELADVLSFEIESVTRSTKQHIALEDVLPASFDFSGAERSFATRQYSKARQHAPTSQRADTTSSNSRHERIKEVLTLKGQSSIKDISEEIKDCSEKTIQRELNAMIKDGIIIKEGERRWSKYSIA